MSATVYKSGDRYTPGNTTMLNLIGSAHGMERDLVSSGPSWLEFDRFDLTAKRQKAANNKDVAPMLKSLLAERFELKVREDTKPMPTVLISIRRSGTRR